MTPRQARRERRAAERKSRKAEIRRSKTDLLADPELHVRSAQAHTGTPDAAGLHEQASLQEEVSSSGTISQKLAGSQEEHSEAPEQTLLDWLAQARRRHYPNGLPKDPPQPLEFNSQDKPARPNFLEANRAAINRANAQLSTGPRTLQGKANSCKNATRHGLTSGQVIIAGEDPEEFDSLLADLVRDHRPANRTEQLLVTQMAQSYWLEQRAIRFQNECFTDVGVDKKGLALFLRYGVTHHRAFHKALADLQRLQKERQKTDRGFVSQKSARSPAERGFVSQSAAESVSNHAFVRQNDPPMNSETGFVSQTKPADPAERSHTSSKAA